MKKTRNDLPALPVGFPDQLTFCSFVQPHLATHIADFELSTPESVRKAIFISHGWRLSQAGWQMLKEEFTAYDTINKDNIVVTGKILISMDSICNGPWSLRGQRVTLFDPTLHFELQMIGGDLSKFIDFKKN